MHFGRFGQNALADGTSVQGSQHALKRRRWCRWLSTCTTAVLMPVPASACVIFEQDTPRSMRGLQSIGPLNSDVFNCVFCEATPGYPFLKPQKTPPICEALLDTSGSLSTRRGLHHRRHGAGRPMDRRSWLSFYRKTPEHGAVFLWFPSNSIPNPPYKSLKRLQNKNKPPSKSRNNKPLALLKQQQMSAPVPSLPPNTRRHPRELSWLEGEPRFGCMVSPNDTGSTSFKPFLL